VIAFVRHGETASNAAGLLLGRADPELTDLGRTQVAQLGRAFSAVDVGAVVTSPLTRARETAAAIATVVGCSADVDERLIEIDYGEWDQRPFAELPRDAVASWLADSSFTPPGGENLLAVQTRVASFCTDTLANQSSGGVIVAVSHVSPIKAAVTWALRAGPELSWRMRLDLASITRVGLGPRGAVLESFNETGHLTRPVVSP
jgi:broad specificity phosphatase PhoE